MKWGTKIIGKLKFTSFMAWFKILINKFKRWLPYKKSNEEPIFDKGFGAYMLLGEAGHVLCLTESLDAVGLGHMVFCGSDFGAGSCCLILLLIRWGRAVLSWCWALIAGVFVLVLNVRLMTMSLVDQCLFCLWCYLNCLSDFVVLQ